MTRSGRKLRVCYILAYYSPDYIRSVTLVAALEKIEEIELFQARNRSLGLWRYLQALGRLFYIRWRHNPDYYILGFRGHEIFWLVRLITWGKFLVFDELMSPYDAILNEKKSVQSGGLLDFLLYICEKMILHAADLVLTDTEAHRTFLQQLFQLSQDKIVALPVAANEKLFTPTCQQASAECVSDKPFSILFYGSFLPLHGIEIILQVAFLLRDEPLSFTLIGGSSRDGENLRERVRELGLHNVKHFRWVNFVDLPGLIKNCDLGLGGPFGNTAQGRRVVTAKTSQFLAMAKAVVVGRTDEGNGFVDKQNALLVPQGDAQALAESILWACQHREALVSIGCQGRYLYNDRFSLAVVEKCWREILLG